MVALCCTRGCIAMSRAQIQGFQTQTGTIIPEFDFSDTADQTAVDAWAGHASFTRSVIPYSQFQSETGYAESHPLANLGQTHVLKVEFDGSTASTVNYAGDIVFASPIDMSKGFVGCYAYLTTAARAAIGANVLKAWFQDGTITDYRRFGMPVSSVNEADTWGILGGLDNNTFDDGLAGTPDTTAIDRLRLDMDGDSTALTFYVTSVFYGAKRKPIFMLEQDDLSEDSDEFFADLNTYGLKGAIYAIQQNVNSSNMTAAVLKTHLDNGHAVYGHGPLGMTSGDPGGNPMDNDIAKAQIDSELAYWRAFYPEVLTDEMLMHFALPLGETNTVIREYMRGLGYKTCRRTGSSPIHGLIGQAGYGATPDYMHFSSYSWDAQTLASMTDTIDACIEHGQDGLFYLHEYVTGTSPNRANVQAALAHLRQKVNEGQCDVMLRHKWYEKSITQYGNRGNT